MSAGSPEDEGFLSRWSRRKRELAAPDAPRPDAALEASPAVEAGPLAAEPAPAEPGPVVEPPSLELVDKDFDLAPWLKRNVPESWKLAALRRAWESDPAIRDFENPARDYALDWNTPGGAPGYGPLTESDDVGGMLRSIFGEKPEPEAPTTIAGDTHSDGKTHRLSSNDETVKADAAAQDEPAEEAPPPAVRRSEEAGEPQHFQLPPRETAHSVYAAVQNIPRENSPLVRGRKRGGGAIPS